MKDFFISHNGKDARWAEWIAWTLESAGYEVILDVWDFRPGTNFVHRMNQALKEAERILCVCSKNYFAKGEFTVPEWTAALAGDPKGEKGRLLPVKIDESEVEELFKPLGHINLSGKNREQAREVLLEGVLKDRRKPVEEPDFPFDAAKPEPSFPGGLPKFWNIPPRNPNFTGRKEYLDNMRNALKSGNTALLTQTIKGLGGIGKTQIAKEYAHRHAGNYKLCWWVVCDTPETMTKDFLGLGKSLGLWGGEPRDIPAAREAVCAWLDSNDDWLLVFDNVHRPQDLQDCRPKRDIGHIVITSRWQDWGAPLREMEVKKFDSDEAVKFLAHRTGLNDPEGAAELAEALDYFPLALDQAGAYIAKRKIDYRKYLDYYREHKLKVLEKGESGDDYKDTVATTWNLSFDIINGEFPEALELFNLLAFLAPEDIPIDIFSKGAEFLPDSLADKVKSEVDFEDVIGVLLDYSLLSREGDLISYHRLIGEVIRDKMNEEEMKKWGGAAVVLMNKVYPYKEGDISTWKESERLLPHAVSAAEWGESLEVEPGKAGRLLNQTGAYLDTRADFKLAKSHYERARDLYITTDGADHPNVAACLNNLGYVLKEMGDYTGAKKHYERALKIDIKAYGDNHPEVATDLNNLGLALKAMGDYAGAKENYERALEIDMEAYSEDHPNVAIRLNNLGVALDAMGDYAGAKENYERALRIDRQTYGENHPTVATRMNNLGGALLAMGDYAGAKDKISEALEIARNFFPEDHPTVILYRENLETAERKLKS